MKLTPQEQLVAGILAISTISHVADLSAVIKELNEKGYNVANIPPKYTDVKYIVNRLKQNKIVDEHLSVTTDGLKAIDNVKFPIRVILHLYHKFGQYESKL